MCIFWWKPIICKGQWVTAQLICICPVKNLIKGNAHRQLKVQHGVKEVRKNIIVIKGEDTECLNITGREKRPKFGNKLQKISIVWVGVWIEWRKKKIILHENGIYNISLGELTQQVHICLIVLSLWLLGRNRRAFQPLRCESHQLCYMHDSYWTSFFILLMLTD